ADDLGLVVGLLVQLAGFCHGHGLLDVVLLGIERHALHVVDQLGVGIEVGHRDDLANFGVGITASAGSRERAKKSAATGTPAQVGLFIVSLLECHLLGGAHVGQGQNDVSRLALQAHAAGDHSCDSWKHATEYSAEVAAAGVVVLHRYIGDQHIVGR